LGLRWSDFNSEAKTLRIDQTVEYTRHQPLRFEAPKSERGRRTIILDDTLVALLLRLRSCYERIVAGIPDGVGDVGIIVKIPDDWLIFHAPDGDMNAPRHPDAMSAAETRAKAAAFGQKQAGAGSGPTLAARIYETPISGRRRASARGSRVGSPAPATGRFLPAT
jgi:hypothetical protein